jgi:putative transposase
METRQDRPTRWRSIDVKRERPHRRTIRLPNWDYRLPGPYAITMCSEGRVPRFGTIHDGVMMRTPAGDMVHEVWMAMSAEFPTITLDDVVIMPNHVHAILLLDSADIERNPNLGDVVQRFKSISTTRYITGVREGGWEPFDGRLWQRNYYEHIIRDDRDLERCRAYIGANPSNWPTDQDNIPLASTPHNTT